MLALKLALKLYLGHVFIPQVVLNKTDFEQYRFKNASKKLGIRRLRTIGLQ